jgi:two-component system cell cycle response regulator CtrA
LSEPQTNQLVSTPAIDHPSKGHPEVTVRTGRLAVNLAIRVATVDEQPVHLTGKEYTTLELFSLRKGIIVTKEMLLDYMYRDTDEPDPKIIDVFVCKLRKKLAQTTGGNHYIETVWGRGYISRTGDTARLPPIDARGSHGEDLGRCHRTLVHTSGTSGRAHSAN